MNDEEKIRRIVVAEVASQLKPFADQLKVLEFSQKESRDWQLSFYSNGVGVKEGLFQRRIREDDVHRQEVKAALKVQDDKIEPLVSYVWRLKIRQEMRDEFWRKWGPAIKWTARSVGASILAATIWIAPHAWSIGKILWMDYLKYHPALAEQIKTADTDHISQQNQPQDAQKPYTGP